MAKTISKTKLAETPAERQPMKFSFAKVAAGLVELVDPFAWTVNEAVLRAWSDTQLKTVELWIAADSSDATWVAPDWMIAAVEVPYELRKSFKTEHDVRALLSVILETHADFGTLRKSPELAVEILKNREMTQGIGTPYGTVFIEAETLSIWFGRKHQQLPALCGQEADEAIRTLFNVLNEIAPTDKPVTSTVEKPKSTDLRTLASPPPAASVSGPGLSKKTRMVAKKQTETEVDPATGNTMQLIDIDLIVNDKANRKIAEQDPKTKSMAENIKVVGLLQPITVRPIHNTSPQRYMITAGERRWRACQLAGRKTIPCIVRETTGIATAVSRLSENLMRENLTPIELATEFSSLLEAGKTQNEIGKLFGVTQPQISSTIRLLSLPASIQQHVSSGAIKPTLIREVLSYCKYEPVMTAVAKLIESRVKDAEPVESTTLRDCLRNAVLTHSRSMKYDSGWADYQSPAANKRHFKTCSDENLKELAPVEFKDLLSTWEGQERTFNKKLFSELNAKPLQARREKHQARKAKMNDSKPSKEKSKSKVVAMFDSKYLVEADIANCFAVTFADLLEKHRDKAASFRVCLAIAISTECLITDTLLGNRQWSPCIVSKVLEKLPTNPKQLEQTLRSTVVAMLREEKGNAMRLEEAIELQAALNADLTAFFVPSIELLDRLTQAGRDQLQSELSTELATSACLLKAWPVGFMPEFLRELVFPKPAADKKKKAKAA